jgi:hypothetical protein
MYSAGQYTTPVGMLWIWRPPEGKPAGGGVEHAIDSVSAKMKKKAGYYNKLKLPPVFPVLVSTDSASAWTDKMANLPIRLSMKRKSLPATRAAGSSRSPRPKLIIW